MKFRSLIFWGHLITGLTIGSVLLVVAVTGALISFEPQIAGWADRHVMKVTAPQDAVRKSPSEIVEAAQALRPGIRPTGLTIQSDLQASAVVAFERGGNVYLDPYTGRDLGERTRVHDGLHEIEEFHRWIGSKKIGKPIANACVLALLGMIVSGLILWWPKQWNASVRQAILFFNPKAQGRARDWNWHNTIGFWCAPFLLVTVLTGLVIAYSWANQLVGRLAGDKKEASVKDFGAISVNVDFDKWQKQADLKVPNWQQVQFKISYAPAASVSAAIVEPGAKSFMKSKLTLNPETGEVVKWEPYNNASLARKIRVWLIPLHTGRAWGVPGQILMLLSTLGAALLVWTGFAMAWRRFFSPKAVSLKK